MSARNPPPPGKDLVAWARQLHNYLIGESQIKQAVEPMAVLLAHKRGDESAAVNGILLYDPVLERVVVSINGVFVPLH